jgi:hypothetical protein
LCFCEVGSLNAAHQIAHHVAPAGYEVEWSGIPLGMNAGTGLLLAYRPELFRVAATERDTSGGRPRWFAVLLQLRAGSLAPFWIVVTHWKSNLGGGAPDRLSSARQIGEWYLRTARRQTEAMILVGDFNCEPMDPPFHAPNNYFRGSRERGEILRDGLRLAYFFNPMWHLLAEPDLYEATLAPGYVPPRPTGTWNDDSTRNYGWRVWDQLLVTKPLLTGPLLRLREDSIALNVPANRCTDHCALSARFIY